MKLDLIEITMYNGEMETINTKLIAKITKTNEGLAFIRFQDGSYRTTKLEYQAFIDGLRNLKLMIYNIL